jgi:hypothetical protein
MGILPHQSITRTHVAPDASSGQASDALRTSSRSYGASHRRADKGVRPTWFVSKLPLDCCTRSPAGAEKQNQNEAHKIKRCYL